MIILFLLLLFTRLQKRTDDSMGRHRSTSSTDTPAALTDLCACSRLLEVLCPQCGEEILWEVPMVLWERHQATCCQLRQHMWILSESWCTGTQSCHSEEKGSAEQFLPKTLRRILSLTSSASRSFYITKLSSPLSLEPRLLSLLSPSPTDKSHVTPKSLGQLFPCQLKRNSYSSSTQFLP